MTYALGPPVNTAGRVVAALAQTILMPVRVGPVVSVSARKEPVAILIHDVDGLLGLRRGVHRALEQAEVRARTPGLSPGRRARPLGRSRESTRG